MQVILLEKITHLGDLGDIVKVKDGYGRNFLMPRGLAELATADILLELPTSVLCVESCKGLCPVCGANLNEGDCGCDRSQRDPRLDKLRGLLDE